MAEYAGFVARLNSRDVKTSRGVSKAYSIKLEKADGTEYAEWISFGFEPPKFKEGDYVTFQAEKNARGYVEYQEGTGRKPKNPPARAAKAEAPAGNGGQRRGGGERFKEDPAKSQRITLMNSADRAAAVVKLLSDLDALPMSSAKTKAGEAARQAEVLAYINKLTVQFFHDTMTGRLLTEVADGGAVKTVEAPLPEGDKEAEPAGNPGDDAGDSDSWGSGDDDDRI